MRMILANIFTNACSQKTIKSSSTEFLSIFAKTQTLSLPAIKHPKLKNMKIKYDKETDILYVSFLDNKIVESNEQKPGIIMDYDKEGNIVGLEILNASEKIGKPGNVIYEVA
jgi:uncharacterized protein YuzE